MHIPLCNTGSATNLVIIEDGAQVLKTQISTRPQPHSLPCVQIQKVKEGLQVIRECNSVLGVYR